MSISAPGGVSAPTDPSRVRFLAFLLDDLSRGLLLAHVHELGVADDDGWTTHADHVTFAHTPSAEQLASFPWGVPCEMEVVGFACDERCRAVQVDVPSWVPVHPQVAVPHVTVSCAPGARALESDAMLAHKMALGDIMFTREFLPLTLRGRFGGVTMSDARVFAQPGVMDAATRTAVAAVVQADAAADAADAAEASASCFSRAAFFAAAFCALLCAAASRSRASVSSRATSSFAASSAATCSASSSETISLALAGLCPDLPSSRTMYEGGQAVASTSETEACVPLGFLSFLPISTRPPGVRSTFWRSSNRRAIDVETEPIGTSVFCFSPSTATTRASSRVCVTVADRAGSTCGDAR